MTEAEWNASAEPEPMLAFVRGSVSEESLRLFACSCCRRIWGLIADERARRTLGIAERFARGIATVAELEAARNLADAAREDAHDAEYEAEAKANFCYTERYCIINARLYAVCAVRQATSVSVSKMDDHRYFKDHGSHYWAAAAEKNMAMASVFERFGDQTKGPIHDMAISAGEFAAEAERRAQAEILRGLIEYPRKV